MLTDRDHWYLRIEASRERFLCFYILHYKSINHKSQLQWPTCPYPCLGSISLNDVVPTTVDGTNNVFRSPNFVFISDNILIYIIIHPWPSWILQIGKFTDSFFWFGQTDGSLETDFRASTTAGTSGADRKTRYCCIGYFLSPSLHRRVLPKAFAE